MKGVVFKELIDMAEEVFDEETIEQVIAKSDLSSGGAYTSVGTYDHGEILEIVSNLSKAKDIPVPDLVKAFGKHLSQVFKKSYADFFNPPDAFSFLKTVDQIIHVEVKKLYPDAELPQFEYEEPDENTLIMIYSSTRPFADLAEGLISGVIDLYQENIEITIEGESSSNNRKFVLIKKA